MNRQMLLGLTTLCLVVAGTSGDWQIAGAAKNKPAPSASRPAPPPMTKTVEVQTTGVKEITTKIYHKYMGTEGAATPAAQQNINAPRVILKITPKKIESLDTTH